MKREQNHQNKKSGFRLITPEPTPYLGGPHRERTCDPLIKTNLISGESSDESPVKCLLISLRIGDKSTFPYHAWDSSNGFV
jgi:hypothetical protein